jgi:hypothetical protein
MNLQVTAITVTDKGATVGDGYPLGPIISPNSLAYSFKVRVDICGNDPTKVIDVHQDIWEPTEIYDSTIYPPFVGHGSAFSLKDAWHPNKQPTPVDWDVALVAART